MFDNLNICSTLTEELEANILIEDALILRKAWIAFAREVNIKARNMLALLIHFEFIELATQRLPHKKGGFENTESLI